MKFKTSLDKLAKIITIVVTLLFAFIILEQSLVFREGTKTLSVFVIAGLLVIYFVTFALSPVHYTITPDQLIIHKRIGKIKIDKKQIKSVELSDREMTRHSVRIFGVGGLFGYFGRYVNAKSGSMYWYATRRDKFVLITTMEKKKIVLSPDDPEGFVQAMQ